MPAGYSILSSFCSIDLIRITMYQKSSILLAGTGVRKFSFVACGCSPIKVQFSDYPKSFTGRINEVYVFFKRKSLQRYFIEKININFIYNRLFCCNHTCYCVGMISVTSVSSYVTSVIK